MKNVRWAGVVSVLLAVVAGVGCSGRERGAAAAPDGEQTELAVTATTGPGIAPSMPAGAADARSAAVAAVRGYYAALDLAARTGDVASALQLVSADCGCRRLLDNIAGIWRAGRIHGARIFVLQSATAIRADDKTALVRTEYGGDGYLVVGIRGEHKRRVAAVRGKVEYVELVRKGSGWLVHDVSVR